MKADRDVTRLLRSWLRVDRGEDADRIIDSVLGQIDWIEQRRPGRLARRFSFMNSNRLRFGIAAAAVVAAAFLGLRFLPANIGESIPETAFTSERYHYRLMFQDDAWTMTERPGNWHPGTMFNQDSAGLDVAVLTSPGQPYVLLTSQPRDVDRDDWLERHDRLARAHFSHCQVASTESRKVDGEEARVSSYDCERDSGDGVEAIIFHADRVYAVRVFHATDASYDPHPVLNEFLDLFRFTD
jgi:hypothetical protein